jgi:hypothetical protein
MPTKPEELPSVADDLALPGDSPLRPNLRALRTIGEKWGATTQIQSPPPTTPLESLRIDVPDYLARELRVRCAEQKVTNAYLVMMALAKDGYRIEDKDLVQDRYKRGKR